MMNESKRTASIALPQMRKWFAVKPLAVGISAIFLSGCGEEPELASIYTSIDECASDNPNYMEECTSAYKEAKDEALRTGPKFLSEGDCEFEFGQDNCEYVSNQGSSFFMPFMAGYLMSEVIDEVGDALGKKKKKRRYYMQPMFPSYSRRSSLRGRWFNASGKDFGSLGRRDVKVYQSDFKKKPTVNRTVKRGGFGKSVARSSSSRSFGG